MDALGLLAATVAVAVFPGGVYFLGAALAGVYAGGIGRKPSGAAWQRRLTVGEITALAAAGVAVAWLPLPGSPGAMIPPDSSVGPNVFAIEVLLAVALAASGDLAAWPWCRRIAAAAAAAPLIALTSAAASVVLSPVVMSLPSLGTARPLAGVALLLAAPGLVRWHAAETSPVVRGGNLAAVGGLGLTLIAPAGFFAAGAPVIAACGVAAVAGLARVARSVRGGAVEVALAAAASAVATAAVVAAVVAGG